ncbi:glycoprotein-N-acetylgalactosamine 3-beta-galactosyltransferase 1-like [Macrobrachium nipponense]|uniref:glycoprotein-N-acetylgalactosamine 3-beta-galactosyltransferase 1-like n=1 Tax=Macrobrachium nipponense TaxID=159736 RepID=UPI0030C7A1D9
MRNGARSLTVVLALCTGCFISSLIIYYDTSSLALRASFLSGLLLNLGQKDNTSSIKTNSDERNNKTSILCWVMTTPKHNLNAIAVKDTWGKRCDKLIFFGDKLDEKLESVKLSGVREDRYYLWGKTREALKYLYDYYLNDFDWFYKADDDTYAIMENLRYVLTPYDPEFPIGLGERALVDGNKAKSYLIGGKAWFQFSITLNLRFLSATEHYYAERILTTISFP